MRTMTISAALVAALALSGCSSLRDINLSKTQERVLVGAGVGAAVGGAFGLLPNGVSAGTGALIGAGVGAAGGLIYDQLKKANTPSTR
ncbi:MAG: YMGG-like glycine zipper-containing protein [Rhodospirillales bacterium]|jgi:hypothetical protein